MTLEEPESKKEERFWNSLVKMERKTENSDMDSSQVKLTDTDSNLRVRKRLKQKLERRGSLTDKPEKKSDSEGKLSWIRSLRSVQSHCDGDQCSIDNHALSSGHSKSADCLRDVDVAMDPRDGQFRGRTKSETWLGRTGFGRSSMFKRSLKTGSQEVDEKASFWRRISSRPRICLAAAEGVVRTFLRVMSMFLVASWCRLDNGVHETGRIIMNACRCVVSFCVEMTPQKTLKSFMIRVCLLLPDIRHRQVIVRCLQAAPSKLTKRAVAWYTKNVSLSIMWWHTLVSLKQSSTKTFLVNFEHLLSQPRKLMQTLVMAVSASLEAIARSLKSVSRKKSNSVTKTNVSKMSWKLKKAKTQEDSENVRDEPK